MAQQRSASKEIFVGGTNGISKREICEHFQSFGVVSLVRLVFDRLTGRRRGFGFVQFKLESSAQQALLGGRQHNIAGRHVTVQPARAASRPFTPCSTSNKPRPSPDTNNSGHGHNQICPYAEHNANPRQPLHRHASAHPASPTLLDIIHEVPTLPELLNMDDQKGLSAVSRSLRRSFVARIQVVTVTTREDLALVNQSWPLLSMVTLQTKGYCYVSPPPARSLACVGVLAQVPVHASTPDLPRTSPLTHMQEPEVHEKIFMLTPLNSSASLALASPATQQLAHYLLAKWRKLTSFSLICTHQPAAGVALIAQLSKGGCSLSLHLNFLNLAWCGLTAQDCRVLSQGDWPALAVLVLSNNKIDAEGITLLAKGKWPRLKGFQLSCNPALDAEAMSHLVAAKWPLKFLGLSRMPISAALSAELAQLHLSTLTSVTLTRTGHIAAAVSELARADWPVLSTLELGHNALDAAAMQHLCRIHMPALQTLALEEASITAEGAFWLARGSWPRLQSLDLSYNHLDAQAIRHIISGAWPKLQSLSLIDTLLDDDDDSGLQQLTKGNWPLLDSLEVSLNMLKRHGSAALLGLDTDHVQQLKSHCSVGAFRAAFLLGLGVARADEHLWPKLKDVQFSCMSAFKAFFGAKQ